ncbi:MAG TPA: kinase/pyrophosphorylase [Candidatus Tectomicrobia bacterium]|nr:kinase/pyrophosphorylase [Candidatus Tectomicrobia bacterium]
MRYSLRLCKTNRWPVVNVTGKAVEETANEVLNLVAAHPPGVEEKT